MSAVVRLIFVFVFASARIESVREAVAKGGVANETVEK